MQGIKDMMVKENKIKFEYDSQTYHKISAPVFRTPVVSGNLISIFSVGKFFIWRHLNKLADFTKSKIDTGSLGFLHKPLQIC